MNSLLQTISETAISEEAGPAVIRHISDLAESQQKLIKGLLILSLTFSSISVLATLNALYWFVKIKRNFRHEQVPP